MLATDSACLAQIASSLGSRLPAPAASVPAVPPARQAAFKAIHPDTGELVEYSQLRTSSEGDKWIAATADEIGRLAQGNLPDMPHGTDTIHFIKVSDIPAGQKATYLKIVAADKPNKAVPQRIRFTVGGDKIV